MRAIQYAFTLMCVLSPFVISLGAADDGTASGSQPAPGDGKSVSSPPDNTDRLDSAAECPDKTRSKALQAKVAALHSAWWKTDSADADPSDLVEAALEAQLDYDVEWDRSWGDAIELLRQDGEISDRQWKQYVTHAGSYDCVFRRRIRADTPIAVCFYESRHVRMGNMGTTPLCIDYTWDVTSATLVCNGTRTIPLEVRCYFDDPDWTRSTDRQYGDRFWERPPFWYEFRLYLRPRSPSKGDLWPTGKARLKFQIDIVYVDDLHHRQKIGTRQFLYDQEIEIVNTQTTTVTMIKDAALREQVAKSIRVRHLQEHDGKVSLPFDISGDPHGLACDVYVRQGAMSWKLGNVISPESPGFGYRYISAELPDIDVNRPAEVVFRPAAQLAETTPHLYEIWGEEIVKRDVPIRVSE